MAILGGAGNVVGGNPAGTGTSLNYIGEHAWGNSGAISINNTTVTALEFSMGTRYLVGQVQLGGEIAFMTADKVIGIKMTVNGETILNNQFLTVSGGSRTDIMDPVLVLLAPFDNVKIEINTNDTNDREYTVIVTGRVYG
jgi:hypothetical protein